jgi:EmrB/QacA subfamily drug resistance transporter
MSENVQTTKIINWKKWLSLGVLSLALAIVVIDNTVLNVSIKNIIVDLGTDLKSIQWAITLYSLVVAALTITGGRLGDLYGRKFIFLTGAIVFGIGSLIASFSPNIGTLIFGWSIIEGIGAALMLPATTSLIVSNFEGRERGIAFGVWGGVAGAASAFGPLLGGYLTTNASWHWAFRINVVIIAILVLGSVLIKGSKDESSKSQLDFVGVILSSLGLAITSYGIIESSTYGWIWTKKAYEFLGTNYNLLFGLSVSFYAILLGLIIVGGFIAWEWYTENQGHVPLLSVRLFLNKQFTAGSLTTLVLALGQTGLVFAIPVFYQSVFNLDAFETGKGLLPLSLSLLFAAPLGGYLSGKIRPKLLVQIGLVVGIVAALVLRATISPEATQVDFIPGLVLFGVGFGLVLAQISNLTLSAVDIKQIGEASGVNSMARQVGATLGSAIIGAVFLATLTTSFTDGVNASSVIPAQAKSTVIQKVVDDSSSIEFGSDNQNKTTSTNPTDIEMTRIAHLATSDSSKAAITYVAIFNVLAIFVSILLPNVEGGRPKGGSKPISAGH